MDLVNFYIAAVACFLTWMGLRLMLRLSPKDEKGQRRKAKAEKWFRKISIVLAVSFLVIVAIIIGINIKRWKHHREEETVKRLLKESLLYELNLYINPTAFNRSQLDAYWLPVEQGGKTTKDVDCALQSLLFQGWHYGKESKYETFEFESTNVSGDRAEIKTREKWYLPLYSAKDESLVKERRRYQEWQPTYFLWKVNGKWLIQDSTIPYTKGPPCYP